MRGLWDPARFPFVDAANCKVHLDMDYLAAPEDFVGLAPMSLLCERLCSIVNPGVGTLDDPSSCAFIGGGAWTERTASDIRWSFRAFISELLQVRMTTVWGVRNPIHHSLGTTAYWSRFRRLVLRLQR